LIELPSSEVTKFAFEVLKTFNLSHLKIDETLAQKNIREEITSQWSDLNSPDVMKSRWDYFKVPKTEPSDYREHFVSLGPENKVLYGIRHMGGNREIPFIQLTPNFEIKDSKEVLIIFDKIKEEMAVFNPLYVCFWSPENLEVDFIASTYMVTQSKRIKDLHPWTNEDLLTLKLVRDNSFYDWYVAGYEDFHAENPELKEKVTVNSLDEMTDSLEHGLLFEILYDKRRIGLIAGEKSSFLGHPGIYFQEIFISKDWKGQGLAKAVQRKFIVENTLDDDIIWGTIDSSNVPSYKTALANGRKPIRFECFVKV
jgi:hypothetical protein